MFWQLPPFDTSNESTQCPDLFVFALLLATLSPHHRVHALTEIRKVVLEEKKMLIEEQIPSYISWLLPPPHPTPPPQTHSEGRGLFFTNLVWFSLAFVLFFYFPLLNSVFLNNVWSKNCPFLWHRDDRTSIDFSSGKDSPSQHPTPQSVRD